MPAAPVCAQTYVLHMKKRVEGLYCEFRHPTTFPHIFDRTLNTWRNYDTAIYVNSVGLCDIRPRLNIVVVASAAAAPPLVRGTVLLLVS